MDTPENPPPNPTLPKSIKPETKAEIFPKKHRSSLEESKIFPKGWLGNNDYSETPKK